MSESTGELLAVYVDGETKTGKGAASKAIADELHSRGMHVYYDVAGDFYRRFTAMVRQELGLSEVDVLPTGSVLETAAARLYENRQAFIVSKDLGDLQRPEISQSVSVLGELPIAQKAGNEWYAMSAQQARAEGADVIVLDGRNPRSRIRDQAQTIGGIPRTILDLYLICSPEEAARRALLSKGVSAPTAQQLAHEAQVVVERRNKDRQRAVQPFVTPVSAVIFTPGEKPVQTVLEQSWRPSASHESPANIVLDNTGLSKPDMIAAVSELAREAVDSIKKSKLALKG